MGINLGGILGGIAGLIIPGGGAISAALGSGIGTLISGGKPKDAIKNAVLFGAGSAMFPGVASALQQTSVSRALGGMGLGTKAGIAAQVAATAPSAVAAPAIAAQAVPAASGIAGLFNKPGTLYAGLALAGALDRPESPTAGGFKLSQDEGYESWMSEEELRKNLYASAIDGKRFDSAEERDAYDAEMRNKIGSGIQYAATGGLIRGPGSVTSDDIPARIYQDGRPVGEAALSNGEVVLSGRDLAMLDPDGDHEKAGRELGDAPNGSRGAKAAEMFARTQEFKKGMRYG